MAITITVAEIAAAIRVGDSSEETAEVSRIRDYAIVAIRQYLGDAYDDVDDVVLNMAATLLSGWLYDKPTTTSGFSFANAIKFSGAIRVLFPYKLHNVGLVDGNGVAVAQAAVGSVGNPVTDVAIMGAEIVVTFADGSTETHDLPAVGVFGTDQDARDSAAANATAIATNTAAITALDTRLQPNDIQPGDGIAVDVIDDPTNGPGVRIRNTMVPAGPVELSGTWNFRISQFGADGWASYQAQVLPGQVDTWTFGTGTTYTASRAPLLALVDGDTILVPLPGRFVRI